MGDAYGRASGNTVKERLQWVLYGLIAGLLIGLVLGWIFSGIIGTAFKMLILAVLLVPIFFAWRFWNSTKEDDRAEKAAREAALDAVDAIEAQGRVVHQQAEVIDVRER